MKQLNETFEDKEFEELKQDKGDKTWHQYLLDNARKKGDGIDNKTG